MNNFDVARAFINGKRGTAPSFTTDGKTLYSYKTAVAKRMPNGEIIINNTKYSPTTTKHISFLKRNIPSGTVVSYTGHKPFGYSFDDFDDNDFTLTNDDKFKKALRNR